MIATGVATSGYREVLELDAGDSGNGQFWTEFLASLKRSGLKGASFVISDAHEGLQGAIEVCFIGVPGHHCRIHFMRKVNCSRSEVIPDMHITALTIEHGLTLCPADSDLLRYEDLNYSNPLTECP